MSMNEAALAEHRWLARLVGEWEYESECDMGPEQGPGKMSGTELVRPFGDLWVIGEGSYGSGADSWQSIITLGYHTAEKRFVGTFVANIMTHMWVYSGQLEGDTLTLAADGPDFHTGKTTQYQDILQVQDSAHRTLTSRMLTAEGTWVQIMQASYRRKR